MPGGRPTALRHVESEARAGALVVPVEVVVEVDPVAPVVRGDTGPDLGTALLQVEVSGGEFVVVEVVVQRAAQG